MYMYTMCVYHDTNCMYVYTQMHEQNIHTKVYTQKYKYVFCRHKKTYACKFSTKNADSKIRIQIILPSPMNINSTQLQWWRHVNMYAYM